MLAVPKERFWVKGSEILFVGLYNNTMMPEEGNVTSQKELLETATYDITEAPGRLCFR